MDKVDSNYPFQLATYTKSHQLDINVKTNSQQIKRMKRIIL